MTEADMAFHGYGVLEIRDVIASMDFTIQADSMGVWASMGHLHQHVIDIHRYNLSVLDIMSADSTHS